MKMFMGSRRQKKAKDPKMGMSKHRVSGYPPGPQHFTGIKKGKKVRRNGKRPHMKTRKMRRAARHSHVNKYKKPERR